MSLQASCAVRRYSGEHMAHAHEHAQLMFALEGRMELEVEGRAAFADTSSGVIIPAGCAHGFVAPPNARMLVIDAPAQAATDHFRRFAVTAACRQVAEDVGDGLGALQVLLAAPHILLRRTLDLATLDGALRPALHAPWSTARMAALFHLSAQRFHARLVEVTGLTPQAYLRALRLREAMRLVAHGAGLETAALQVGYRTASALGVALKREGGAAWKGARAMRKQTPVSHGNGNGPRQSA
jgi:AraC-like DNA-binding protein